MIVFGAILWLPAGYLATRFFNAYGPGSMSENPKSLKDFKSLSNFEWKKPAKNPDVFALGVSLGLITFGIALAYIALMTCLILASFLFVAVRALGKLAPK